MRKPHGPLVFALLLSAICCLPLGSAVADDAVAEEPAPAPAPLPADEEEPAPAPAKKPAEAKPAAKTKPSEDVVILQNGSVWTGRIIKEDENSIIVEHTSKSGGIGRYTFPRSEVKEIKRAEGAVRRPQGGPRPIRDEWFLLRRGGRIVGTRRLELWRVRSRGEPGFRLEEKIEFFAQGPQLPATRTHRTEEVDNRFHPRLLAWHEEGDRGAQGNGTRRYSRDASGRVVDGVWRGSVFRAGEGRTVEVRVPRGTRGRLGHREHLLRIPRRVHLMDTRIIDPNREGMVQVRAGFTSIGGRTTPERPGDEFHWEEGGRRLVSYFNAAQRAVREEVSEGILALPVTKAQAAAALAGQSTPKDAATREVKLAEAGIAFTPPDSVWTWKPSVGSPAHTGWRVLGRLDNRVLLSDVRIEWHPHTGTSERTPARVEAWLIRRLRGVSPDQEVVAARRQVQGLEGAWRIELAGTLKKESVRTTAVVVDRRMGRVVLLLAGPAGAWGQVRPALERLLESLRLL